MTLPRYLILHGHFYQPPRESPWTGLITPEAGARPFANFNERIRHECYLANAYARTVEGKVVRLHNNYQLLDFDFGPTLMHWMESHGRRAYRAVLDADLQSGQRNGGHGNAIAQSYSHSILPLLTPRDRELQIAWGIADFVYRFGRQPEGMWLPECAVDEETLAQVSAAGLKFVILGAHQGRFTGQGARCRTAGPFWWRAGRAALAVFRFDEELSNQISFGDGLQDGERLARSLATETLALEAGEALLIATDGETFGHHKQGGASQLARAMMELEQRRDIVVTNCAQYLALHPGGGNFEIYRPSSWSCPHGLERWRSDCGCRLRAGTSQLWRRPLREAMEFVAGHTRAVYDRFAPTLVDDPAAALLESIRLLIDPDPAIHAGFFARHKLTDEALGSRLVRVFEMVRAGQAALTSCAWFFDDFTGPEGQVVLLWAARAVELAAELAPTIEAELLMRLREIRSSRHDGGDAATLYLSAKTRAARRRI